jgi:two-component system, NarL family, sensor kinase
MMVNKGQSRLSDAMAAEEGARARIAADIHDDTIQTLSAVAISLENARDGTADADARAALKSASWHVRDAASRLRRVMAELMPPLSATDLRAALEAYCSVLFAGSGMAYEIAGEAPEALDAEVGAVAYRVAQEAARNALRHSGAGRVRVELECASDELVLSVSDDGVGLGEYGPDFPAHAGLRIIDQRAGAIGGSVTFTSGLGGSGTSVVVSLPLAGDGLL